METKLINGDYVADGLGGVERCAGDEALLARVLYRLAARRGGLPLLPELGSRLYLLPSEPPLQRLAAARQYVHEALSGEPAEVTDVELTDRGGGRFDVTVRLTAGSGELTAAVTV